MATRITLSSEAVPGIEAALTEKLELLARRVVTNAQRTVPVDTYNLRDSIESDVGPEGGKIVARIGTDVEYGLYVEQGTSRARAQPWLRPAAMQAGAL